MKDFEEKPFYFSKPVKAFNNKIIVYQPRKEPMLIEPVVKRGRGRPKGSTNKPKEAQPFVTEPEVKRGRGKPKGSNSKALHKNIG